MCSNDDIISCYSRAQALADGVLVDLSEWARRHSIQYPTACTARVQGLIDAIGEPHPTQRHVEVLGRTDALLVAILAAIRAVTTPTDRVRFEVLGARFHAVCGPGDTAAPVITILLEGEDCSMAGAVGSAAPASLPTACVASLPCNKQGESPESSQADNASGLRSRSERLAFDLRIP